MGYETYVTGGFVVKPKLSQKVIEDLGLEPGEDNDCDLIAVNGGQEDTVGLVTDPATGAQTIGVIAGTSWTELERRWEEPYKAYNIGENLEKVVKRILKEGHTIEGALYLSGEEDDDFSRYRVENGKVVHETPEFLWPNGDKGWG